MSRGNAVATETGVLRRSRMFTHVAPVCGKIKRLLDHVVPYAPRRSTLLQGGRSLAETGWSPAGVLWRNRTLVCLQRALSQAIPRNGALRCNCLAIKRFAFDTHARCYTQLPTSICRLPVSDWLIATRILDTADLLSEEGTRQILAITQTCLGQ
jgi:hypothetical protein